jgi:hypothetical protein
MGVPAGAHYELKGETKGVSYANIIFFCPFNSVVESFISSDHYQKSVRRLFLGLYDVGLGWGGGGRT